MAAPDASQSIDAVYYVDSPVLRAFIDTVNGVIAEESDRAVTVRRLRPSFTSLLDDHSWLPATFTQPDVSGGMGGGIGNYLIYRSGSRDLSLMSLVVPGDSETPVHDHLAWGLVGLYSGRQEETMFRKLGGDEARGEAILEETERRSLEPADFYELLPPKGDIHRVRTIGAEPSVSIHLLGNDVGCVWRHRYEPHESQVHAFRSGYSNQPCADDEVAEHR